MSSYEFRDTQVYTGSEYLIPSEAMYIWWKDSFKLIEDNIDGYKTLNVSGRELFSRDVSIDNLNGGDGGMYTQTTYPQRVINVKYLLDAKDDEDFRRKFEYLNYMLSKQQFRFKFHDDPNFEWVGTVSSVEAFPEGTNNGVGTFEITCSNPFKRLTTPINNTGVGTVDILEPLYFGTVPDVIEVVLSKDVTNLTITDRDLKIELNGSISANSKLEVLPDMAENPILINGVDKTEYLNLTSDLENFAVLTNDQIVCSDNKAKISIKVRSKRL